MTATPLHAAAAAPAPLPPGDSAGYSPRQIQFVVGGLMLAMLLAALDQTIVSTALTTISQDFGRPELYSWVITAYLLTSTATTPLYGKVSDLYGRKRIFQVAIVLFLIGSALCGLAQNMIQLIVFRGVQGLGAGGLMTLAMTILGDVVAPRQRGRYQGYFGAVFGASSIVGPLLGGFLVDQASWRWVFYVNIPVGIVALVVVQSVLHGDRSRRVAHIDALGALLLVSGTSLFLVAVQSIGQAGRVTSSSWLLGGAGLLLVAAFLAWERRAIEPLVPLSLFRNRVFAVASALALITGAVMFGAIIFLPQYLQLVQGLSPTASGLQLLPLLVGLLASSIGSGRLVSRYGRYKAFVVVGTALLSVGFGLLSRTSVDSSLWTLSVVLFIVGVGLGLFMQTLVVAAQNAVGQRDLGVATSTVTFSRTLGGALGASVLGAVVIAQQASVLPAEVAQHGAERGALYAFTAGMDRAYLWAVPIALLAFGLSFLLRDLPMRSVTDQSGPAEEAQAPLPPTATEPALPRPEGPATEAASDAARPSAAPSRPPSG